MLILLALFIVLRIFVSKEKLSGGCQNGKICNKSTDVR